MKQKRRLNLTYTKNILLNPLCGLVSQQPALTQSVIFVKSYYDLFRGLCQTLLFDKCKNNFVLKKNLARKCTLIEKWGTHVHSCCKFPHQLKHNHEIDKLESCLILWMRTITKTMLMFYLKKSSCCKWAIPGIFFICFLSFQTEDQFNSN